MRPLHRFTPGLVLLIAWISPKQLLAEQLLPSCLTMNPNGSIAQTVLKTQPSSSELLARLVYAESRSTGFSEDHRVYQGIAWGVMNRVRLGEASPALRQRYGQGVSGVIFQRGQFNPAVSPRSPFSRDFLCPQDQTSWGQATTAASLALRGEDNPFIQTDWERRHGLSLVVNFYYPRSIQARGPLPPWEGSRELRFIGEPMIGGAALSAERVRFYRLTTPPTLSSTGE